MIECRNDDGLWIITLNRPEKANSLTSAMLSRLCDIVMEATVDPHIRALIVTGEGDKVFSAGADLDEARAGLAVSPLWEQVSAGIAGLPCLTVAALNGTLAGGAFGMALACDLRIAVPNARFFYPVVKLGFLPQPSDPGRLVALMGPARAKLLLLGGQKFSADEALAFGLIDRITLPEHLIEQARDIAGDAVAGNAQGLHRIKAMCEGR